MSDAPTDPLIELFQSEVREQLALLTRALQQLDANPGDRSLLEEIVQAVHTIRGATRIVQMEALSQIMSAVASSLARVQSAERNPTANEIERWTRFNDALGKLAAIDPSQWSETQVAELATLADAELGPVAEKASAPSQSVAPLSAVAPEAPAAAPEAPAAAPFVPFGDSSLLEMFREEVRSHAASLNAGLLELEREPANPQRIEPLMRAAHSLKGAARIIGLDPAVRLAHEMEDAFVAAGAGRIRMSPLEIDVLLRGTDLLGTLSEEDLARWPIVRGAEVETLRQAVAAIVRGETPNQPAVAPTPAVVSVAPTASPETTPAAAAPAHAAEPSEAVVRVTAQSLDRLMNLAGESLVQSRWLQPFAGSLLQLKKRQDRLATLLEAAAQNAGPSAVLEQTLSEAKREAAVSRQLIGERMGDFEDHARAAEDLNARLYREVIVSRMRPFADGVHAFPRLVRDTARRLGKQARLDIIGQTTEVDRDILEKLEAPLTHILRNAVDHGLEEPDRRNAAGKPAEGVIRLEARHRAGMLSIAVSDDGGGIDIETVRRKVVDRRHATAEMAAGMGEAELLEFLFLPGFSTAGQVTEVSGRGVGLDVVQDTVRRVGGSVQISTQIGRGTRFHLLLPITLSVLRAVLVDIAGEPYAFPHNRIDRLLRVDRKEVRSLEHRQFITVDGRHVGLALSTQLFDLPAAADAGAQLAVLLLSDATGCYGLIVDAFRGEQDLVVRPLDPRLGKIPNLSAAAVLDDGSPVLIADVEDLFRSMDQFIQAGSLQRCDAAATGPKAKKRVLVVDDSITVREVQRQILRTHGYHVEVAVDGQDGLNALRTAKFDLVISDVDMPRMTGLELVRRIREDHIMRELPVIIVSYKDREEDRLRGLQAGANHYLTKSSFHDATFLDAVVGLIGRPE
jgi:two-component system sensor histidine kinase and response regulator WspE